jgi:hypothetical protein
MLAYALTISIAAGAASPSASAQDEIAHLLSYVETSGCDFYRNGTWYSAREARAHLEKKYQYLVNRSRVRNAEDFIDKAASSSSVSGEPYQVRCRPNETVPSAAWLRAELDRFRASRVEPRQMTP